MINEFETILEELKEIEKYEEKLGEIIYDEFNDDMNFTGDIGNSMETLLFSICETDRDVEMVDETLIALTGVSLSSLVKKIMMRDKQNYVWESI